MSDEQPTTNAGIVSRPAVQILPGQQILAQQAEQANRDREAIERLIQTPMRRSESIGQLALALSKAQGEMGSAIRDSANPFFKSRFASRAACREAYQAALTKYELALFQPTQTFGRYAVVTTVLAHSSGEYYEATLVLTAKDDSSQAVMGAVTYGLRYGAVSMTGIAIEDDDGESSVSHAPEGVRHDKANTPLQQAVARQADEVREGPKGAEGGGISGQVPTGGTPPPPAAGAAPRSRPSMGATGTPPPPGKPPMRAPGSAPLQGSSGSSDNK